jgi:lipopolysaccharide transport system permease protein
MFRNDTRHDEWDQIIKPKIGLFDINFRETWQYRDLIALFVRRDFIYVYKQTILGPLWYLIQPLLTTLVFTVVFSNLAKIPTDGLHPVLFYLAGTVCWNYFSESVRKTSATFVNNASLLGKVYFPRLVMPVSIVITTMFSFVVQIILLAGFIVFYSFQGVGIHITAAIAFLPFLLLLMAFLGLGLGIIVSAMTVKYRDLIYLINFSIQLLMYATPVIYSVSSISGPARIILLLNPMSSIIEFFRYAFLGKGFFDPFWMMYSIAFTGIIFFIGVIMYNRVERTFLDTI